MYSLNNNQIKFIKSLHHKKYRQEHKMFLIEGEKLVNEVIRDKPNIIEFLVVNKDFQNPFSNKIPCFTAHHHIFESLSLLASPPPIMAVCKFLPDNFTRIVDLDKQFTFYLHNINDPGNLGTIIRICDWFGIPQLFCSKDSVELYNPKTINASKGSFLRVKVDYIDFKTLLLSKSIPVYSTDMNGKNIKSVTIKNGIIVLGNESHGVSDEIKSMSKEIISIPKHPDSKAESLNVAMSASIICSYLSLKQ
ncbi:MAG: RNA methyltransferase [Bacteroidia bacterium]|nr:RNA methyltransferase [Bacteroidia bacterium]